MTREETLNLTGRELDTAICRAVMGLEILALDWPCQYDPECGFYEAAYDREDCRHWEERGPVYRMLPFPEWDEEQRAWLADHPRAVPVPFYSRDPEAALEVAVRLRSLGWDVQIHLLVNGREDVILSRFRDAGSVCPIGDPGEGWQVWLCRAALLAAQKDSLPPASPPTDLPGALAGSAEGEESG